MNPPTALHVIALVCISGVTASGAPGLLVCHFDTPDLRAAVNDFGAIEPTVSGFAYWPEPGCPADPTPGALEAGIAAPGGSFTLPIGRETSLSQGTLEMWVKLDWDFGERAIRNFVTIPLAGGHWNSIGACHHGLIGPKSEVFESNIMDGLDHPLAVEAGPDGLNWRKGEWHHLAICWTEHSQRLFGDGKLLSAADYRDPLQITPPTGKLYIGCGSTGMGEALRGLVDELRLCTLPLYAGMESIPVPDRRLPDNLPPGLALTADGATAYADSTAADVCTETDVPALHNGAYGDETRIGLFPETGDVTITLAESCEVAGLVWSRDGRAFAGPEGQGWARADSLPRDFVVEASRDGETWTEVARRERFKIDPRELVKMTAARFTVSFEPVSAQQVRMRIIGDTTAKIGQWPLLDEVQVLAADGTPARIAQVTTERTRFQRSFPPGKAIDGRVGEQSLWKSATPGQGELTVVLAEPKMIGSVSWSRSREGLGREGTPADVIIEVSSDGLGWEQAASRYGISEPTTCSVSFAPRQVKSVRLRILRTTDGAPPAIDEVTFPAGGDAQ